MQLENFITQLRKEKDYWLSFYKPSEILYKKLILPKKIETIIEDTNNKAITLIKYLYNNFFDDIKNYLNLPQIEKTKLEAFNYFHRYDLFFDKQWNPKIVEFNMDVAWGHIETLIMNDINVSKLFLNNFINWLKKHLIDGNIFIVVSTSYREDYKIWLLIKKIIEIFLNKKANIVSPIQLSYKKGYIYYDDIPINNLIRYYPWDRFLPLDLKTKTNILNPKQSFLFQQKSLFSFMRENIWKFNKNIQQIIKQLIPYTIKLEKIKLKDIIKNKNKRVIKHINDREWNNIFIWELLTQEKWEKILQKALKQHDYYVLQEKIDFITTNDNFFLNFWIYNIDFEYSWIYLRLHRKIKTDISSSIIGLKFK